MADVTVTASSVVAQDGAKSNRNFSAGVAITAGQMVYLDTTTSTWKLADADLAAARSPAGMALNSAAIGQPVAVCTSGPVVAGGTLTQGATYYLSKTAGGFALFADITGTGTYPTSIGIAVSTTVLNIAIVESNAAL